MLALPRSSGILANKYLPVIRGVSWHSEVLVTKRLDYINWLIIRMKNKKLSDNLLRLIKPFTQVAINQNSEKRLSVLLTVASAAWNYAVTDNEAYRDVLLKITPGQESHLEVVRVFDQLIARKNRLFAEDERVILNCSVGTIKRKEIDITVSFLTKEEYLQRNERYH